MEAGGSDLARTRASLAALEAREWDLKRQFLVVQKYKVGKASSEDLHAKNVYDVTDDATADRKLGNLDYETEVCHLLCNSLYFSFLASPISFMCVEVVKFVVMHSIV